MLDKVCLFNIPKIPDERGNLSFLQQADQVPFELKQVYWINDIPSGATRAGQANANFNEVIIALSGSFDVTVKDGDGEKTFCLNRPDVPLLVPPMVWRQLSNFSTNSVAFIITDEDQDKSKYFTDYPAYINALCK